jgi:hypothetical protein
MLGACFGYQDQKMTRTWENPKPFAPVFWILSLGWAARLKMFFATNRFGKYCTL